MHQSIPTTCIEQTRHAQITTETNTMGNIAQEENKRQTQENPLLYPTNNDKKPGREGDS